MVLNGHVYEVFDPQNPNGGLDQAKGIREFVVGTGGKSLNAFGTTKPNSDVRLNTYNGVIKLTLHPNSYDWQFVTTSNVPVRDSGSGTCHGGTTPPPTDDTTPPTVKSSVPASGATGVSLATPVTATFSEAMDESG